MTARQWLLILISLAYVLGSIPFGLIVGLSRGVDIRQSGSKNIGATNAARVLGGKRWFFLVFFLDMAKGFVPMLIASLIVHQWMRDDERNRATYALWLSIGVAAILGHMFSVFLKFKGGKGVATSAGVVLGLIPYFTWPGLVGMLVFALVFLSTRIVSLGSMVAALAFPVLYLVFARMCGWPVTGAQLPLLVFSVLIALLIVFRHRANIARLIAGTEHRFSKGP